MTETSSAGLLFQLFVLAAELHAQDLRGRGAIPISASMCVLGVEQWAKSFGLDLYSTATTATQAEELEQKYQEKNARVEYFDPEEVIDVMKARLEKFLGRRRQLAEILKENLENSYSLFQMVDREAINDLQSDDFYRFVDSKSCLNRHYVDPLLINSSLSVNYIPNPNFFNLPVNTEKSAVHVPTPVYARDPELLSEIIWTESLDDIFKARRAREFFAASWQYFCSQKGFMRFYPASPWFYDDSHTCLDMYIDAATHAKNIIIMLDMSGSMLGQRFEIAKQTIEMILETLTENDFFNMIVFSEEPKFILSCFRNRLVQATIKNKKLMRVTLDNVTAEGIANYPAALSLAFEVLIEASQNPGVNSGCQNAIMLITDGPSDTYEDIFEKYNKDKMIRFFTYLIGDDVTETREVRWMACYNRGYFAHISNLADVQEKVQSYIGVMSRLTAERNRTDPVWTGAYYDRLGAVLVATVAFPVVANDSFRGVVGASALITELQQMAPLYMLGTHSYTFIVDNNGYVVHHPQLRPLYMGKAKPHYNSMDIMEMEVLADNYLENGSLANPVDYDSDLRRHLADGVSSKDFLRKFSQKIIWACDGSNNLRRVYLQNNVYYYRGINNTLMSLALAVPEDSRYRIALPSTYSPYPFKNIDCKTVKWFSGTNWRLHPDWHYCRINDSDYSMTKEEAFVINMRHYSETGRIARNCALYTYLIERLLFDAEVTSQMDSAWIQESRLDERKGVHLVYLATHAGLTRFVSMDLKDVQYQPDVQTWQSDDNRTEELPVTLDKPYFHFSKRHTRALDEVFYKRAMQFLNGEFVFDVNITNNIYLKNGSQTYPHAKDGRSIIVTGNRAILVRDDYGNEAPASVVGFEMLYASFEEMIYNASHKMCHFNSKVRCYLLDEHGYIVYASLPHTSQERVHYLRQFFGHLSLENTENGAIERYLMKKLVDLFVYQKLLYVDFQDLCQNLNLYNSARRLFNPLLTVSKLIISMLQKMIRFFLEINPLGIIFSLFSRYTTTFRDIQDGLPCDRASSFYLLNNDFRGPLTLAEGKQLCSSVATSDSYARVSSCNLYAYAVRIEKTNLVLVVYSTEGTQCNGDLCKDYFSRDSLPWGFSIALNATDKVMHPQACKLTTRYRRPPSACQAMEDDDPFAHCSGCSSQATLLLVLLCVAVLFTECKSAHRFDGECIFEFTILYLMQPEVDSVPSAEVVPSDRFWATMLTTLSGVSVEELTSAIAKCKDLVLQTAPMSAIRRELVRRLIELRQKLHELKDGLTQDSKFDATVMGHQFKTPSRTILERRYCECCGGLIWAFLQPWYFCRLCGFYVHVKCVKSVKRQCASLTVNENPVFELEICPERGLAMQNFQCADCKTEVSIDSSLMVEASQTARLCHYSGSYFCSVCHWNDEMVIPARVIHNWDFTKYTVSRCSRQFLRLMQKRPILRLEAMNSCLFKNIPQLQKIKTLRARLLLMKPYVMYCREAASQCLMTHLRPYAHFMEALDVYSIRDLIDINETVLESRLMQALEIFEKHIKNECSICQGNGYVCELCDNSEILFPFDRSVGKCGQCSWIYHKSCFDKNNGICPRCLRMSSRMAIRLLSKDSNTRTSSDKCSLSLHFISSHSMCFVELDLHPRYSSLDLLSAIDCLYRVLYLEKREESRRRMGIWLSLQSKNEDQITNESTFLFSLMTKIAGDFGAVELVPSCKFVRKLPSLNDRSASILPASMNCSESENGRLRTSHDVEVMRKNLLKEFKTSMKKVRVKNEEVVFPNCSHELLEIQWNSDRFFQRKVCSLLLLKTKQQLAFSGSVEFALLLGRCHVFGFELEASIPPKFQHVFSSYYGSPLISFNTGKRTIDESKVKTHEFIEFCYVNVLKPLITKAMMKRIQSAAAVLIIRCVQLPLPLGTSFERMSMIEPQNCTIRNNCSTISEKHALIPGIFLVTKKTKLHAFSLTSKEAVLFDKATSQTQRFAKSKRYSILFCGHIASGKSTRLKYFANRLLSRRVKTYLLDLDLGQSEMTLPGCISLTKLDEPLYGVNLKRMNKCEICYFYGEISPSNRPKIYLQLINRLYEEYLKITEDGVLLINCNGWISGLGLDILLSIVDSLKPDKIFFFENCNIQMSEAAASRVARLALEERTQIKFVGTSHLRVLQTLDKKLLRSHSICNYFAHNYKEWINFFNAPTVHLQWKKCFIAVAHANVDGKFIMCLLKASVVGLCHLSDHNAEDPCEEHYCNDESLPAVAPPGAVPLCIGFGIVSYVDTDDQTIHLRTPLSSEQLDKVNLIVCGELEIPQQIFNCQSLLVNDNSKLTHKHNVRLMADIWRHWKNINIEYKQFFSFHKQLQFQWLKLVDTSQQSKCQTSFSCTVLLFNFNYKSFDYNLLKQFVEEQTTKIGLSS
ncbi:Voltage-dependent calcium channel unc-36 [Trichinella zimbabwensis]|uniref:Voltage-dependent calcium channel unc-36 n=1 Tax=Trichinella zimbabwensis TaxID=268475 RepID=A0A0V1HGY2_9BILA|nr:Voltage-dependent calcium channel unc-36 [Trichinella zimbabwensis]